MIVRMKWICCVGLLLVLLGQYCDAADQGVEQIIKSAELAYQSGEYKKSEQLYYQILDLNPKNKAVLYNLGNVNYSLNHIGKAIYFYKKALDFNPRDKEAAHNLAVVSAKKVDHALSVRPPRLIKGLNLLSMKEYVTLLLIVTTIFNVSFILWIYHRKPMMPVLLSMFGIILIVLLIGGGKLTVQLMYRSGILIAQKIAVKSGPSEAFSTVIFLHEGTEVYIVKKTKKWTEVVLQGGVRGWVKSHGVWGL